MAEFIQEWLATIAAAISVVLWGARLENRSNQHTKDLENHASQNAKDLADLEKRLAEQRKEDLSNRARDWGRMEAAMNEMRSDIKELLKRGG